jgi:ribonuclease E
MSKEIYISSTPHETRLAIVEKDELAEIYYERENEYTLAGSIYNGRVTRVLPGMQSAFVDVGLERDAFLYITDFMEEQGDSADFEAESSRNGRGERRERGEGRRRERQPAQATATEEEPITLQGESESSDSGEETGEGSRRWRGRRGRRRGRADGDGREGESTVEAGTENGDSEPRESRDTERGSDRHRGGGDRDRQDAVRERFAPRGHRHSAEESIDINASAEPFILPGESLSKYRRGEDAERPETVD